MEVKNGKMERQSGEGNTVVLRETVQRCGKRGSKEWKNGKAEW